MTSKPVIDERVVAVAHAGSHWALIVLTFALLIDVMVRGLVLGEAAWDLLALVFVSSSVATIYQRVKRVQTFSPRRLMIAVILSGVIAAAGAALISLLMSQNR